MIAARDETGRPEIGRPGPGRWSLPAAFGGWLGLAAAPTFAAMAILTGVAGADADVMCSAAHGASSLGGMAPMYALMSAFHAAPWVKLMSRSGAPARRCEGYALNRASYLTTSQNIPATATKPRVKISVRT
jgi:hypothetical protein